MTKFFFIKVAKYYFETNCRLHNYTSIFLQGDEFVFYEDWGEQLVGKSHPVLCILDVDSGVVSTLDNVPDNISPGQVSL